MELLRVILFSLCLSFVFAGEVERCTQYNNDCSNCVLQEGCGYCGAFGAEGWCVPGTAAGSNIVQYGADNECPANLWKVGGCSDPFRLVQINATNDKVEFASVEVTGQTSETAEFDAVIFTVSGEPGDDGRRRAGFLTAYGTGVGKWENIKFNIFAVVFENIIEFVDVGGDGFTCKNVGNFTSDCVDAVNIRAIHPITNFSSIVYENMTSPGRAGGIIHIGTLTTDDGQFQVKCRMSNTDFDYQNIKMSPYNMKCDVIIDNWQYTDPQSVLAVQTFILAGQFVDKPGEPGSGDGQFQLGGNLGFFKWSKTVQVGSQNYPVLKTDVEVSDSRFKWDTTATVFTTVFTFESPAGTPSQLWDPIFGVTPKQYSVDTQVLVNNELSSAVSTQVSIALLVLALIALLF